jgi:ADP-ribose pyrophosphatase YjhB (NUDIX family)
MKNLIQCIFHLTVGWWRGVSHRPESLRYALSHQTVDMVIYNETKTAVLMGSRTNGGRLRFPGGFTEAVSKKLEDDAIRETKEETSLNAHVVEYMGSFKVNDDRYTDCDDKVKTAVFKMQVSDGDYDSMAGADDLPFCNWISITQLRERDDIVCEHAPIVDMILKAWGEA